MEYNGNEILALLFGNGVSEQIGIVQPDQGSSSDASFKPGTPGLVALYNISGGLRLNNITDPNTGETYPRLMIAAADDADIAVEPDKFSVNKPIVPANFQKMLERVFEDTLNKYITQALETYLTEVLITKTVSVMSASGPTEERLPPTSYSVQYELNKILNTLGALSGFNVKCKRVLKGETWNVPPSTLALVSTYGCQFSGFDVYSNGTSTISFSNIGIIMNAAPMAVNTATGEEVMDPNGNASRCFAANLSISATSRNMAYKLGTPKIVNNYSGSSGSGATYIYYVTGSKE